MALKLILNRLSNAIFQSTVKANNYCTHPRASANVILQVPLKLLNLVNLSKNFATGLDEIPVVSYEEIKEIKPNCQILIDVREHEEIQQTGKIPNSINVPLSNVCQELSACAAKSVFKKKYGRDKPERNSEIIFYCKSGKRAESAARLAKDLGYENVKVYTGSWSDYVEKEGLMK